MQFRFRCYRNPYFYLYVILDIFSRRVVGWQVADTESAALFKPLFDDTLAKHQVPPGQLTLHADRGGPMKAKATALLLADLGVTKSHSRPHTSNDNPFSEAHFKTLKYQPEFPRRFGCIEDQKAYPKGIRVSDEDMAALNIHRDPFHGEWNYTIKPQKLKYDAVIL